MCTKKKRTHQNKHPTPKGGDWGGLGNKTLKKGTHGPNFDRFAAFSNVAMDQILGVVNAN